MDVGTCLRGRMVFGLSQKQCQVSDFQRFDGQPIKVFSFLTYSVYLLMNYKSNFKKLIKISFIKGL